MVSSLAITQADPQPRAGATALLGVAVVPARWFSGVVEMSAQLGHGGALDFAAAGVGLRFSDQERFGAEVGAAFPFAGLDRGLVTAELRFTARLDRRE